ncbi:hypothetical protein [Candidatus Cyanaurora vandensis]|uniref:hypothetical protein n=1 Tax=Candidatus Cyanaurora vandensis TaxID=2714958 RepID=UPI00258046D2|nr:hypothetical protein [Candidatus Cyanaurora vandensis]
MATETLKKGTFYYHPDTLCIWEYCGFTGICFKFKLIYSQKYDLVDDCDRNSYISYRNVTADPWFAKLVEYKLPVV